MEEDDKQVIAAAPTEEMGQPQPSESAQDLQPVESPQDRNWRELRKSKDELERKSKMQEQLLEKLMTQAPIQAPQPVPQVEEDYLAELSKEDFAPGEKVAKTFKKLEDKYEKRLQEIESKYAKQVYDDKIGRLAVKHPDLYEVVNLDTLKTFSELNPDLAATWKHMDDYSVYLNAYPMIKASGLIDNKSVKRAKEVEQKLEQNKKTVQSPAAVSQRAMAQAFDATRLSQSQKEELAREMSHYGSMAGGVPYIS